MKVVFTHFTNREIANNILENFDENLSDANWMLNESIPDIAKQYVNTLINNTPQELSNKYGWQYLKKIAKHYVFSHTVDLCVKCIKGTPRRQRCSIFLSPRVFSSSSKTEMQHATKKQLSQGKCKVAQCGIPSNQSTPNYF